MPESFRKQDMKAEQQLAEFMDVNFYSRLKAKNGGELSFSRMTDKETQLSGVDICIETNGRKMLIDEKTSVYYSNAMIPTFAFELDSIQRGHQTPVEGWFINDQLKTEYYMLIWPNIKCTKQGNQWIRKDINHLQSCDFTIVEAILIEKKDIRIAVEKSGYNRNRLLEYARRIRQVYSNANEQKDEKINDKIKISFSGQLAEKPINVVIRKELLSTLAKGIYLISEDGFATIKG